MCWTTKDKKYAIKKIAEHNIPVYKVVRYKEEHISKRTFFFIHRNISKLIIRSMYYDYFYELNKTYKNDELILEQSNPNEPEFIAFVDEGFHSYNEQCFYSVKRNSCGFLSYNCLYINKIDIGNDTITYYHYPIYDKLFIMHCIIPTGAEYCENENGEIVSNQIKPISIEKIKIMDK